MGLKDSQKQVIEKLYKEMYYPLSAYAQSALNDRPLAEEAVQDTFRIACTKADDLLSSPNVKGWLLNTLKYVIKNIIRCRARLNNVIITSINFDENTIAGDEEVDNIDFLYSNLIDSEDYKLLKRIALDKCTMLEAAKELGISVEACKKRVQRAKKRLKKRIEEKN